MSVKQEAICCIREAEKINKQATEDKVVHVTAAHLQQHDVFNGLFQTGRRRRTCQKFVKDYELCLFIYFQLFTPDQLLQKAARPLECWVWRL